MTSGTISCYRLECMKVSMKISGMDVNKVYKSRRLITVPIVSMKNTKYMISTKIKNAKYYNMYITHDSSACAIFHVCKICG